MTRFWYRIAHTLCFIIFRGLFRYRVYFGERIPRSGKFMFAANHVSHLDPVASGLATWRGDVHFLAKEELFTVPVLKRVLRLIGVIPLNRHRQDIAAMRTALQCLAQGEAVALFPEGTRSADGSLREPELGIGFLVSRSRAPVIPLYVKGTHRILPKRRPFGGFHRIEVFVGEPLFFDAEELDAREKRQRYRYISDEVMNAIKKIRSEAENYHRQT